jgi:rubrerythrin
MANIQVHEPTTEDSAGSRRHFLKGAAAAGLLAIVTSGASSPAASAATFAKANLQDLSDADILNFALSLEHLEAEFYKMAVDSGNLDGDALEILTKVRDHEIAHVDFLTKALTDAGAEPVEAQDSYNFGDMSSEAAILKTAEVLEETGVGAYTGAAALIDNKDYLAAAASIEQVEARHHGAIRYLNDKNPAADPLGIVLTVPQVQERVAPILGS